MVVNVVTIESARSVRDLARLMLEGEFHRLPVVADGELIGLVTSIDLVRAIAEGRLDESDAPAESGRLLAEG